MYTRVANLYDREPLVALGCAAYAEARYGRYPLSVEKIERLFDMTQQDDSQLFVIALLDGTEHVGMMVGLVTDHFFADMVYATNLVLYVKPEKRGSHGAVRLIRHFESEAIARGAQEILIGATSNVDAARTITLYARLGYQPIGANSVKYIGE